MANKLRAILGLAIAVQLGACEPGVHGVVLDATTETPVGDATVGLWSRGYGSDDPQVVWDKDYVETVQTAADGSFLFKASEGIEISVRAPGHATVHSSLCSKLPMIVRIDGPFAQSIHKQLLLGQDHEGAPQGWNFEAGPIPLENADLSIGALPDAGQSNVQFSAPLGMSFQAGAGNPPLPPTKGYVTNLEIDLMDCGWLFVKTGQSGTVAVQTGQLAIGTFSGAGRHLSLTYVLP